MNILHLSTSDNNGGASRAAYRLNLGLLQKGIQSQIFVRDKITEDASVIRYKYPKGLKKAGYKYIKYQIDNNINRYQSTRPVGFEVFSDDRSPLRIGFYDQLPVPDLYHLHWTSGLVDLPSFFRVIKKPVVWTLHDMFPFTGGCHYNSGCENYLHYCHSCPQLGSGREKDLSFQSWTRKFESLSEFGNKFCIRADSRWLANEARKSTLFKGLDIDTIHYGIETDEFVPLDKIACRRALNIPPKSKVIVFGAPGINNPRKGYKELLGAMEELHKLYTNLFLLSFGTGSGSSLSELPSLHLGHVANNMLLSIIYNCADVFVIPSLQEAFGQTALEAMSCGIPVAGFDTGGIPDMVEEGVTGYLAETGSIQGLAGCINKIILLNRNEYETMASNCREKVLKGFTIAHQAEKYVDVYQKLL